MRSGAAQNDEFDLVSAASPKRLHVEKTQPRRRTGLTGSVADSADPHARRVPHDLRLLCPSRGVRPGSELLAELPG